MNNGYPVIIQGGMGAGVSNWQLAQAVSKQGQLGVVAGTALDQIFARRLQDGDPGGHMRRAMDNFPFPEMAERVWREYYIPGGRAAGVSYKRTPKLQKDNPRDLLELSLAGNFAEVWLARQGHTNPVGINYLEKIQTALLSAIYGAMLGGVEYVIVGAGIPIKVPGVLDALANHQPASYPLAVSGVQDGDDTTMHFDPRELMERELPPMKRPRFLAIIASNVLGTTLLKRSNGKVDGLIIEHHTAGGHNAPPRGKLQLTPEGEAIYGERDVVDIAAIAALGVPFWLAGGYGSHEKLLEAQAAGATGVQVGTAFAYSNESGLREDYKQALRQMATAHRRDSRSRPRCWNTPTPTMKLIWDVRASATSDTCARPTARPKEQSRIAAPPNPCRCTHLTVAIRKRPSASDASAMPCWPTLDNSRSAESTKSAGS